MSKVNQRPAVSQSCMIQASKGKDKVAQRGNLLSSADLSMNDLTTEAAAKMVGKCEGTHRSGRDPQYAVTVFI